MAKIVIPTPLRKFTGNEKNYETEVATVDAALNELTQTYPDLKGQLFDEEGKLRSFIKVFVGEDDIKSLENGGTAVESGTVISIVPAIAGGSNE